LTAGVGSFACLPFCFAPCLACWPFCLLARETLVFRRGRCRQPNSNLLTPQLSSSRSAAAAIIIQRCRVSFSSRSESYMPLVRACRRGRGMYHSLTTTTTQPRKSHCLLSAYASTDATSQTMVVSSLIPRATRFNSTNVAFAALGFLACVVYWRAKHPPARLGM
jgi:hypothetical protein